MQVELTVSRGKRKQLNEKRVFVFKESHKIGLLSIYRAIVINC
jgi:hypothetical protein